MTKIILTNAGSHSLFSEEADEHYHSKLGAISESLHVFIKNGINRTTKKEIKILEIGFGSGLNALLTQIKCEKENRMCHYYTLEKFPVKRELISKLNYCQKLEINETIFNKIHDVEWNVEQIISPNFTLTKLEEDVLNFRTKVKFDIIYFDAFSPEKQPKVWEEAILKNMYSFLLKDGFLITYCAKGIIKRRLKKIGFEIESLAGPMGKREITQAKKK